MFGLGKLLGAVVDVALTPVEIVKDIATIGDGEGSHTLNRLAKAEQKVSDAADELAE